jgi:Zn-dependent membrane protease YugP
MNEKRSSHGNTPAAWTTVTIAFIAFIVGAVGIVIQMMSLFWIGIGLLVVSVVVGKLMQMAGLGQIRK